MMEKFKVGQKVKCVWTDADNFKLGAEYKISDISENHIYLHDDSGCQVALFPDISNVAKFEPVTPKFTAVSGDQSLFDLVGASDDELYIRKLHSGNGLIASEFYPGEELLIAERKPYVENYVPKVGDYYRLTNGNSVYNCVFVDLDGNVYGNKDGYVFINDSDVFTFVKVDK